MSRIGAVYHAANTGRMLAGACACPGLINQPAYTGRSPRFLFSMAMRVIDEGIVAMAYVDR